MAWLNLVSRRCRTVAKECHIHQFVGSPPQIYIIMKNSVYSMCNSPLLTVDPPTLPTLRSLLRARVSVVCETSSRERSGQRCRNILLSQSFQLEEESQGAQECVRERERGQRVISIDR